MSLCRDWLMGGGLGTPRWTHVYVLCLDSGVNDPDFLEAGFRWLEKHLQEKRAAHILATLLRAAPESSARSRALPMLLDFLKSQWGHPSWLSLWTTLLEGGFRPEVEELAFTLTRQHDDHRDTSFVVTKVSECCDIQTAQRLAGASLACPWSPCSSASLLHALALFGDDPDLIAACLQWLEFFQKSKPKGWTTLFCSLQPEHQTRETLRLGLAIVERAPCQRPPTLLNYLGRCWGGLDPESRELVLGSMRRSLNRAGDEPDEAWGEVTRFLEQVDR